MHSTGQVEGAEKRERGAERGERGRYHRGCWWKGGWGGGPGWRVGGVGGPPFAVDFSGLFLRATALACLDERTRGGTSIIYNQTADKATIALL